MPDRPWWLGRQAPDAERWQAMDETALPGDGPPRDRRRPWVAALLGLAQPPLCAFYLGRPIAGAAIGVALVVLAWLLLRGPLSFALLLAVTVAFAGLTLGTVAWGIAAARRGATVERRWYTRWYGLLGVALALAVLNPVNWLDATSTTYHNDSRSMEPAIVPGDYFLTGRATAPGDLVLRRGEIVVYRLDQDGQGIAHSKRVIGLPGDRVAVRGGIPWVNGTALARQAADAGGTAQDLYRETSPDGLSYRILDQPGPGPLDEWPEQTVPEGFLFVLGDHRDRSLDSRVPGHGFVRREGIVGTPAFVFWSRDLARIGTDLAPAAEP